MPPLSETAQRVQSVLDGFGRGHLVFELEASTRTSAEAAAAVGTQVERIAKSVVFRAAPSGAPVLVLASGANRVDTTKLAAAVGHGIERADANFVRASTGFAIGGVPPVGHAVPPIVVIDRDLLAYTTVWGAAGTPRALFETTPADLLAITGGAVFDVRQDG